MVGDGDRHWRQRLGSPSGSGISGDMAHLLKRATFFARAYLRAAASCLYLFAFGFLFSRNRPFISAICRVFGHHRKRCQPIIPNVEVREVVEDDLSVQLLEPARADGNISLLELLVIVRAVRKYSPSAIFEIGTFDGRTALNMACNCSDDAIVYTLDLPRDGLASTALPVGPCDRPYIAKDLSGARYLGTRFESKIKQLYGDSATFDFSPYLGKIDLVFVDGAHTYEYVLNDSRKAAEMLKGGRGAVFWHDYDGVREGVTRALNELYSTAPGFGRLRRIEGTSLVCLIADQDETYRNDMASAVTTAETPGQSGKRIS